MEYKIPSLPVVQTRAMENSTHLRSARETFMGKLRATDLGVWVPLPILGHHSEI